MKKISLLAIVLCYNTAFVGVFIYYDSSRRAISTFTMFIYNTPVEFPWRWTCINRMCVKTRNEGRGTHQVLSLDVCKLTCGKYGVFWPKPTGKIGIGKYLSNFNINSVEVRKFNKGISNSLVDAAVERFKEKVEKLVPVGVTLVNSEKTLHITFMISDPNFTMFILSMNESYTLRVTGSANDNLIKVRITARTFFGARHGLETLLQLIAFDEFRDQLVIVRDAIIVDEPVYGYRGLLLDTSRHYYDVASIKRTIDAMAAVKLNTFHWHIVDSQSFPFVSERRPNLSKLGAYSSKEVYTMDTIKDIVEYGLVRGVRILPEFDAPGHVGEGWQDTNLTVCFDEEPWWLYCTEPPCGQLNPTLDEVYDYLEDIYADMTEAFRNPDLFHMGGDEVNNICWVSSLPIRNYLEKNKWKGTSGYLRLVHYFQQKAQKIAYKAFGRKIPVILWSSRLTKHKHIERYLSNEEYIIQVWTNSTDDQITGLLAKGYHLIISNRDVMYLDCGFEGWLQDGNNWCTPYNGWQEIYDHNLAKLSGGYTGLVLGGEVTMWSEQSDATSLDNRLWPRSAALAEMLWTAPTTTWDVAYKRFVAVRNRLVRMGIQAYPVQPEWCTQNEDRCLT